MSKSQPNHIVIIGGGFSGAMTAVHLARLGENPLRITIVHDGGPLGRGVAYAQRRPEYLLNVASRNMSAFSNRPDHFVQWLRTRPEFESVSQVDLRERFISREIYGDYLRSVVALYLEGGGATTTATTESVHGQAVDIEPHGARCLVRLADGSALEADRAVLAIGNEPPAPLPGAETLASHPAWVGNPWQSWEQRLPQLGGNIVILGTGLTAVDAILTLRARGWTGSIDAVSRHGWFPHAHFRSSERVDFPEAGVDPATLGLERLLASIRQHCALLQERNVNPAIIVDKLRPHTQRIWSNFSRRERLAFAKHHAARWNVFRHRIAPRVHSHIAGAQLSGQLQVHAGGVVKLEGAENRILIHMAGREPLVGDLVLNATGPSTRFTESRSVLLQNLLRRGLVAPDDTNMGVRIDSDFTLLRADDQRSPWLLALGPILKGTYWETIAVPELRKQTLRVAQTLLDLNVVDDEAPPQFEYMI